MATIKDLLSTMIGKINEKKHWDDIEGKPFGETTVMGDTLTWDGNTEGMECVNVFGSYNLYRVSDATPTMDAFANGATAILSNGGTITPNVSDIGDGMLFENNNMFGVALQDNVTANLMGIELTAPKKGIYVLMGMSNYMTSLTINGYNDFKMIEIETIDPKYLPKPQIIIERDEDGAYATDFPFEKAFVMEQKEIMNNLKLINEMSVELGTPVSVSAENASTGRRIVMKFEQLSCVASTGTASLTNFFLMWNVDGITELTLKA